MANALAKETSPYLLQHRDNPVDWLPWGEQALGRARELDRPLLVSIGYSACHWCHVMERECFEDEEIAAQMNEQFVCVKVCLLYTSPSPRDRTRSRMPSSA